MPQDIRPYSWRADPWDLHRDGLRFAQEQLQAWEDGSEGWMVPWFPDDPACICGSCWFALPDKNGTRLQTIAYPAPLLVADAVEHIDDLAWNEGMEERWPSIVGWLVDPQNEYFGIEPETPAAVPLWDCWPISAEQGAALESALNLEYEGGLLGELRRWNEFVSEHGTFDDLLVEARRLINQSKVSGLDQTERWELQDLREHIKEWRSIAEDLELDENGMPNISVEDLVLLLPPDLELCWQRLRGSHRRALNALADLRGIDYRKDYRYRWD